MTRFLTERELLDLGFRNIGPGDLDDGGTYEWWRYSIGELDIDITDELDSDGEVTGSYVEIGNEAFHHLKKTDLIKLLKILRHGRAGD
ncbi:hypothetical protein EGI11_03175 [Chryseobacterium sp. H3056]|uniref:Uncharacterized protein n=1 Tax=Kaistella daneshvariae TaxID=2487074 RepID=A0A3N0WXR1_9FLAO|nr:hypothetical protein [Kaistella daneshvariae]ROI09773.1 hypothetical protein EGI11_03175 [Kaistella daneshvariae]